VVVGSAVVVVGIVVVGSAVVVVGIVVVGSAVVVLVGMVVVPPTTTLAKHMMHKTKTRDLESCIGVIPIDDIKILPLY